MLMDQKELVTEWFKELQNAICSSLEELDQTGKFHEDLWQRPEGGSGRSRILTAGSVIEKGGVNFSAVKGKLPEKIQDALKLNVSGFYATGVSIVLHPVSPWMPIIHMNVRYFEADGGNQKDSAWWFGGGIDLTPHYIDPVDGGFIHQHLKQVCDQADRDYYSRFKKWADDYFYIRHREETRGVGGIFFDRLSETSENKPFEDIWSFVKEVGQSFIPIYTHYVKKYREKEWNDQHKWWQKIRRSRYVEFNLVWDKGTKFGLDTNGRTESILMSMPPDAVWEYNHVPESNSPEAETLNWLKKDIDWIRYA